MREALIAVVSALGLGGAGAAITLVLAYRRAGPEFPPPESGQPNP
jgi:hypothetical protein